MRLLLAPCVGLMVMVLGESIRPGFAEDYDLVIARGRVADGTGNPARLADVGIRGGRIAAVGRLAGTARATFDATGLVVAPGFIDVHTHAEDVDTQPEAGNFVRMGVTTIVAGNCGASELDVAAFFRRVEAARVAVNVATLIGHGSVRRRAMGGAFDRPPTSEELAAMRGLVDQAMRDGAVGLSTGLIYLPGTFAKTDELIALARVAAAHDGIYASHMRSESREIFEALAEVFTVAREARMRAQVSHLKLSGPANWGQAARVLAALEGARREGLDVTQDQYLYTASSTGLSQLVPEWAAEGGRFGARLADASTRARIVAEMKATLHRSGREDYGYTMIADYPHDRTLNGLTVVEAAQRTRGATTLDAQIDLILEVQQRGGASGVFHGIGEDDLQQFLRHPHTMIASDSGVRRFGEGVPHPRGYGNAARLLARYVRELRVLRLEEAVRRLTSLPAATFGFTDRGQVRPGAWADLVVFNPDTIQDRATYREPHHYATGFARVFVNGVAVVCDDAATGARPGHALRHAGPGSDLGAPPALPAAAESSPPATAQGTRSDYARAAALAERTRDRVLNLRLEPHWLGNGDRFWYARERAGGGREYVLVDAGQGTKAPLFDAQRLAAALGAATSETVSATGLRLERVNYAEAEAEAETDARLRFRWRGKAWRYDANAHTVAEDTAGDAPAGARRLTRVPRATRRTGPETSVTFVNATANPVELVWLDPDGERRSYGTLPPGAERRQHTYAGHVWLAIDGAGRTVAAFEAADEDLRAEIASGVTEVEAAPGAAADDGPRAGAEPRGTRSPDGRWTALVRDHNVYLRAADGTEWALTRDGEAGAYYRRELHWSPDGQRLVALHTVRGEHRQIHLLESSPRDQVQPKLHTLEYEKPGDRLDVTRPRLFDVTARSAVPVDEALCPHPWSVSEVRWARDSSRFTFLYNQRGHQVLRVVAVDARTGAARALVDETSPTFVDYAHKTFLHWLEDTGELIWMSERDGWNHLYLYDAVTGAVKHPITSGPWVVRAVEHVDAARRQVWFRAMGLRPGEDPYHEHFARIDFDGTGLVRLTDGDGTHTVQFSPDRRFLVDTWSRADHPPVHELRRAQDGTQVCGIEEADVTALIATGWRPPQRFAAKGRDAQTDIYGLIHRPMTFAAQRKYPVIEQIYAGPHGFHVPKAFRPLHRAQELAELGFIVVQIDGQGTSWRSKAFHDVCWQNLADAGLPDRIAWMRAAAAQDPSLDLTRVGIHGGSAGGQSALGALLWHGDFYRVGVADCGCHDNRMDKVWWNELWMGWPVGPHYAEQSNVTQAHRLQGKLLLTVGELDRNVDPASTLQVAHALIKAGKDFELLVVPGAGHGVGESPYAARRRQDFFVRHLLGVEPRARP